MEAHIHTIPLIDAVTVGDECPFCFALAKLEEDTVEYTIGTCCSYMEKDVRAITDKLGFCRHHYGMLWRYENFLGLAMMTQTELQAVQEELAELDPAAPPKKGLFSRKKAEESPTAGLVRWARKRRDTCAVCAHIRQNYSRYLGTFFTMLKDPEFRKALEESKGFCLEHFADLMEAAEEHLPGAYREWFYPTMYRLMEEHLARVKGDLDLFIIRHDYKHQNDDPKNSRDALPRAIEKLGGFHVNRKPYKGRK